MSNRKESAVSAQALHHWLPRFTRLQWLVHVGAWIPLGLMIFDGLRGGLTVNPIQEITTRTGKSALVLLVLALAVTPVSSIFGFRQVVRVRRALGLYAFFYALLHFLIFVVLDYGLVWALIREAIFEKRFALVGFAAFLLLLPMAITSTRGWQRRLGKGWKKLHRLIYVAAVLVVIHFVWLVKSDIREPLVYGGLIALLLAFRLPAVRQRFSQLRYRLRRRPSVLRTAKPGPQEEARSDAGA